MQINSNTFVGRHMDDVAKVTWQIVGVTPLQNIQSLQVAGFGKRSVIFEDNTSGERFFVSHKMANKVLAATHGMYTQPLMAVHKHSSTGQDITWIGEVTY